MKVLYSALAALLLAPAALAWPRPPGAPTDVVPMLKEHVRALEVGTEDEQLRALAAIKAFGVKGLPATPALIAAFRDSSARVRVEIADVLATYGPDAKAAIPTLVESIRQANRNSWWVYRLSMAIAALGEPGNRDMVRAYLLAATEGGRKVGCPVGDLIARYPAAVTPVVIDLLADESRRIRSRAAQSLAYIARPLEKDKPSKFAGLPDDVRRRAMAALRVAIEDPEAGVRSWAVAALIDIDPGALRAAIPVWITLIRLGDHYGPGREALSRRGPAAAPVLIDYLDDPDQEVRRRLVEILASAGTARVMTAGLRHSIPAVRSGVLEAMEQNPTRWSEIRAGVLGRLEDDDSRVRLTAARVLVAIDPSRARAAIPVLTQATFSPEKQTRLETLHTLTRMGPAARPAVTDMLRRVRSGDLDTRFAAAEVLLAADRSTWPTTVPVFAQAVASGNGAQPRWAAQHLSDIGPNASAALPALRQLLADDAPVTRLAAAEAIARIAPDDADDALRLLVHTLGDPAEDDPKRDRFRRLAFRALRRIGPAARPAIPALLDLMRAALDSEIRAAAAVTAIAIDPEDAKPAYDAFRARLAPTPANSNDDDWLNALPELGKAAKPLVPDLIAALNDKSEYRRHSALEALGVLGPDAKEALPALRERERAGKDADRVREVIRAVEGKK
jgi:HEAT repeat protein